MFTKASREQMKAPVEVLSKVSNDIIVFRNVRARSCRRDMYKNGSDVKR